MWKATATTDNKATKDIKVQDDGDWDSDPDFVNAVSEKEQRWGKQKTIDTTENLVFEGDMAGLRQKVVQTNEETVND
jgi:cortactin